MERRRARAVLLTGALGAMLVATLIGAAAAGSAHIPLDSSASILLQAVGLPSPWDGASTETHRQIVLSIRLPRILTAALVGAGLAVVGCVMQALFRNPMADPGLIGVSSGGGLAAVFAISSGLAALHWLVLPGAAFVGALAASVAVFLFSLRQGRSQVATLLLAGVAVTYLCSAATSLIISFTYDRDTLREMLFWLLGGFDNRSWSHVHLVALPVLLGVAVLLLQARTLNLLLLGEEEAQSLGVAIHSVRALLLGVCALVSGVSVAVSGLVGFVGLVIPHLVRMVVGPDHRLVLPLAALGGAWFLVAADTLARLLIQPAELRVGIVTSFVGAPFFLFVLGRSRSHLRSF